MSYAGWLLAELSLILMVVMIGSETPLAVSPPDVTPPTTPTAPSDPPVAVGLAKKPLTIDSSMSKGAGAAAKSLHKKIKKKKIRPAFLLLWGIGNESTGPEISREVAEKLQPLLNKTFNSHPLIRAYYHPPTKWKLGRIYAEVFYFND